MLSKMFILTCSLTRTPKPIYIYICISLFLDVVVQLVPTVLEKWGPSSNPTKKLTSISYAEHLKKCLLEYSSHASIIKKVGCSFDFTVMEEQSACKYVNILCKFYKKSELEKFESHYYNDYLAKGLEQYFTTLGLHIDLGVGPGIVSKEFKLEVTIDRKNFKQKPKSAIEIKTR